MAQRTKTFYGSQLIPLGDASIVGDSLVVSAATSFSDDFSSYAVGTIPSGWKDVTATVTKQVNGITPVIRINATGWGGAYYSGWDTTSPEFGDGCYEAMLVSNGGRANPVIRYSATATKGYVVAQVATLYTVWYGFPANFVGSNAKHILTASHPAMVLPTGIRSHSLTLSNGDILLRWAWNNTLQYDFIDKNAKHTSGNIGLQVFGGTTDYSSVKFWPVKTGSFSNTFTPISISNLSRILVDWDSSNSYLKKTSEVFQYNIDSGTWVVLPDNGIINLGCTQSVGVRANAICNSYNAAGNVSLNSISIEGDAVWDNDQGTIVSFVPIV